MYGHVPTSTQLYVHVPTCILLYLRLIYIARVWIDPHTRCNASVCRHDVLPSVATLRVVMASSPV